MAALDDLPLELLTLIILLIDSPLDLYRLISASPSFLRLFADRPEAILTSTIINAVPHDILLHLLAVLHASTRIGAVEEYLPFLPGQNHDSPFFAFPTTRKEIVALCRLHTRLCHFSNGYFDRAMRKLGICESEIGQTTRSPVAASQQELIARNAAVTRTVVPSESEYLRLQRAVIRFELYSRVFPPGSETLADQQFSQFLTHLAPWEVEEMSCIHRYFGSIIESLFDDFEDQFVEAVLAAEEESLLDSQGDRLSVDVINDKNLVPIENLFHAADMDYFSSQHDVIVFFYIDGMVSMGLDFIYELIHADKLGRANIFRANFPVLRNFLPEALSHAPNNGRLATQPEDVRDDSPSHANLGYYLFQRSSQIVYLPIRATAHSNFSLRDLGYVFWDAERIVTPFVFDKLRKARNLSLAKLNQLYYRPIRRRAANEVLRGVRISSDQSDKIRRQFASTVRRVDRT